MEKCKFNKGDYVRIRPWEEMAKIYGEYEGNMSIAPTFVSGMRCYCGEIRQVVEVDESDDSYILKGAKGYWFAGESLEGAKEPGALREGARVLVRSWDSMAEEFGIDENEDIATPELPFFHQRKEYCGTTLVVEIVDDSDNTFMDENGDWFPVCCVTKVKDEAVTGLADKQEHYKASAMQPLEVMQTFLTADQFKGFLLGNFVKYSMRANFKGQTTTDRDKARQYLYWYSLVKNDADYRICPTEDVPADDWDGEGVFAC